MSRQAYRYRASHGITEKIIEIAAPFLRGSSRQTLVRNPASVLVLKFGGMGEAVLGRSLVERLRERNPSLSFDFLVEKRTVEMMTLGASGRTLLYSPGNDGLGKALTTLGEVRRRHYDAIIDLEQHSLLTAAFTRATSIPVRIGFVPSGPSRRGQMFTHCVQLREGVSMWSSFVEVGRILDPGLSESVTTVPLPVSEAAQHWFADWWAGRTDRPRTESLVALHLGVGPSAEYRRWPIERFAELAAALTRLRPRVSFVLTGAENERHLFKEFNRRFTGSVIDAAALGGLERSAVLLSKCDLLISADTGVMHLAAAMGTPTVGLFGPNTPACWAPVGPRATFVFSTVQPCSPCINSYRRHIPEACTATRLSACMWDITVSDVVNAARRVIRDSWLG